MKPVQKFAMLLTIMMFISVVLFAGCSPSQTQSEQPEEPVKQRIDLSDDDVSYSTYLEINYSTSNFTYRRKAPIPGMIDMYVGSVQLTVAVYSKNSAYQFENAKITVSSMMGLGWDSKTIEVNLTDTGSGERTVTIEYDFMTVPDMPDASRCYVTNVEGYVLI